jgi:predicted  nucleic acid-binding Zn-ribbon protein
MSFEDIKARIAMLLDDMVHQPEDLHELHEQLREELAGFRAQGLTPPQDLLDLEAQLEKALNVPDV